MVNKLDEIFPRRSAEDWLKETYIESRQQTTALKNIGENVARALEEAFDEQLAKKPQIMVINKIDLCTTNEIANLKAKADEQALTLYCISAKEKRGLEPLLEELWRLQAESPLQKPLVHPHVPDEDTAVESACSVDFVYTYEK